MTSYRKKFIVGCNMKGLIKDIQLIPVNFKSTNWDQSTYVVKIIDENGQYGIGECDGPIDVMEGIFSMESAHLWSMNPKDIIIGKDPLDAAAIWNKLYESLLWQGRRGLALFAISGIDIALHDLAGKQLGIPTYQLIGGANKEYATPYMTLYPESSGTGSLKELMGEYELLFEKSKKLGVKAVKLAIMPGEEVSDTKLIDFINEARTKLGYEVDMMVDFLYRWTDPYDVINALKKLEKSNLYFAEAILQHDDIEGHKKVVDKTDMRICGAEMATGIYEIKQWVENSGVAIVQPDINRCGGLSEIRRITEFCDLYGVQVIPHGWKTGITASCGIHYHISSKNGKYFEYLHPELYPSPMRENLVKPEAKIIDGRFNKPTRPGLGIDLNDEFLTSIRKRD
jgi:L-alanine-DL-glutamate epimerase-like enolase superfamily enzyme